MNTRLSIITGMVLVLFLSSCTTATATLPPASPTHETQLEEIPTPSPTDSTPAPETEQIPVSIHTIHMFDVETGWGIGQIEDSSDLILSTNDGGVTWMDVSPPEMQTGASALQADAAFIDMQHAWVLYNGSTNVWSTADAGATWSPAPALPSGVLGARFFALDSQNGWLLRSLEAGMSQVWEALFFTSTSGERWVKLVDPQEPSSFARFGKTGWDFSSSQNGWMTHNSQGVSASVFFQRTSDGGASWENVNLSPPPDKPALFENSLCYTHSPKLFSASSGLVALSCSTFEPDEERHYLYSTEDNGSNWTILDYPGGELYFTPDGVIFAAGSELAISRDRGMTWELRAPLAWDAELSFVSAEIIFASAEQDGAHNLYTSRDGGETWTQLEPVLQNRRKPPASQTGEPAADAFSGEFAFLSFRANPDDYDVSDLYLASLSDTEPLRLTDGSSYIDSYDWDPTGSMIVLSSNLDGDLDLYLMTLDTGSWRQLTRNDTPDTMPAFSPDGRLIAFVQGERGSEEIHLLDLSLEATRRLAEGTTPAWYPDGSMLLVSRPFDGLYTVDSETAEESLLIDSTEHGYDHYPVFSPSGDLLLTASNRHSPGDFLVEAPYLFEANGRLLGRVGADWGSPPYAWLPDGSGLLVTSNFLMMAELQLLDLNGTVQPLSLEDPSGWFPRFRPGFWQ